MPACFAHYRFGRDILHRLDAALNTTIRAYPREFDCGLQGPDIFFFYRPWRHTEIREYAAARHNEPAARMFAPILQTVRENAAVAYLTGLLCHYILDCRCHPYVLAHSGAAGDHQRMEAAFDRALMTGAGFGEERYRCLPVSGLDYAAMATLWPDIDAKTLERCVKSERRAVRLLDRRQFLETCEVLLVKRVSLTVMTLPDTLPQKWAAHVRQLKELYDRALDEGPALIGAALRQMGSAGAGGSPGFTLNYKGCLVDDK